jgi:hypothetical protein
MAMALLTEAPRYCAQALEATRYCA